MYEHDPTPFHSWSDKDLYDIRQGAAITLEHIELIGQDKVHLIDLDNMRGVFAKANAEIARRIWKQYHG